MRNFFYKSGEKGLAIYNKASATILVENLVVNITRKLTLTAAGLTVAVLFFCTKFRLGGKPTV